MPFSGVCLYADTPSDGVPCGCDKPVAFSKEAIENALNSFVGMGVNCRYNPWDYPEDALTGHDDHFKIGVVEHATLSEDGGVNIDGLLWKNDLSEVCFMIKNAKDSLGFSVEVFVENMEDHGDNYLVTKFTFTGVSILYKNLAAFKATQLAAQAKKGGNSMTKEELEAIVGKITEGFEGLTASFNAVSEKIDALAGKEPEKVDFSAVTDAINALGEKIEAQAKVPETKVPEAKEETPAPKTEGMQFASKEDELKKNEEKSLKVKCEEIDNDMTIPESLKAKAKLDAFKESLKARKGGM